MSKPTVKARIQCVVDIPVDHWDANSKFADLATIVKREGANKLHNLIKQQGGAIIGEPTCIFVVIEE